MSEAPPAGIGLKALRHKNLHATAVFLLNSSNSVNLTEIATGTGLSRALIETFIKELDSLGVTQTDLPLAGHKGRPARRVKFRTDIAFALGVDIGAHRCRTVLTNLKGDIISKSALALSPYLTGQERIDVGILTAQKALTAAHVDASQLSSVGIGTTGVVNLSGEVVRANFVNDWVDAPIKSRFEDAFGAPVVVDNDTRVAALAEISSGTALHHGNFLYIRLGFRPSAAIVINGRVFKGATGAAAEIGLIPSSSWNLAMAHVNASPLIPQGTPNSMRIAVMADLARQGNPGAIASFEAQSETIAEGITMLSAVFDPAAIILGGGMSKSHDFLLPQLKRFLRTPQARALPIKVSKHGATDVCLGAAFAALQEFDPLDRLLNPVSSLRLSSRK